MSRKQTPSDFLKQIIGRPVVVKLNNGVDYRGKMKSMNLRYCLSTKFLFFVSTCCQWPSASVRSLWSSKVKLKGRSALITGR